MIAGFSASKKRLSLIFILAILTCACFAFSAVTLMGAADKQAKISGVEIAESYKVGEVLEIQNGTVKVGEKDYSVFPSIVYPDGTVYKKSLVELNQLGKYSLVYEVEVDGKNYSDTKSFCVYDYLLSNSATGEGFKYTHDEQYDISGVRFDLKQGETLLYNKVIDLNEYESDDTLIKFDAVPEQSGVRDISQMFIVLTDVYNPNNVVRIRISKAPNDTYNQDYSYITAAHNGNPLTGASDTQVWQGHASYGRGFDNGLQGVVYEANYPREVTSHIDIRFDYAKKSIYCYNYKRNGLKLVADLVGHFGDNAWEGFTTGEAWLSLYASAYTSLDATNPFRGMILEIDGQDLTVGNEEDGTVRTHKVDKTNAPEILFNEYGSAKNVPNAMVGYAYKIFDTEYLSVYGGEKLYTNVYYGYTSSTRYEVPITNGYFTPNKIGVYTIVYTAVDRFGNTAISTVDVKAVADMGYGIYVDVPDYQNYTSGAVGSKIELVGAEQVITKGNLGSVDVIITAVHESGLTLDVTNEDFIPNAGGKWQIIYSVTDYAGRVGKFAYDLNVIVSEKVIFGQPKDFFNYAIVGAKNPVPELTYIDYNVDAQERTVTTVYVEKDGKKVLDVTDGYFTPAIAGDYQIVYEATSSLNVKDYKRLNVKAVDVNYDTENPESIKMSKYFYAENGITDSADSNGVYITVKENGTFDFIRPVAAVGFNITFNVLPKESVASEIILLLTDVNDKNQSVKLSFIDNQNEITMQINDKREYILSNYRFGGADINFSIKTGIVTIGTTSATIGTYLDGRPFNGFSSMLANLSFTAKVNEGVKGNSTIVIKDINGQPFKSGIKDRIDPKVVIAESTLSRVEPGVTVKIPKAKIVDVLSPYAVARLTVTGTDNQPVKANDGTLLKDADIENEYYIDINKAGFYRIYYYFEDEFGNKETKPKPSSLEVVSRDAPTIKISGGDRTAKVGKNIKIGKATCSGLSEDIEVHIFIRGPKGNFKTVDIEKMTYKVTLAGTYIVKYTAIDEWGNMATAEYKVKVS